MAVVDVERMVLLGGFFQSRYDGFRGIEQSWRNHVKTAQQQLEMLKSVNGIEGYGSASMLLMPTRIYSCAPFVV